MMIRLLLAGLFLVMVASPAQACRYIPRSFDENYAEAADVLIGTVEHVSDDMTVMAVERVYKGTAKAGGTLQIPANTSSCHIRFAIGQKWLYLGAGYPSGSLLLQDEKGNVIDENMAGLDEIPVTAPETPAPQLP